MILTTVNDFTIATETQPQHFIRHNALFKELPESVIDALAKMARTLNIRDKAQVHAKGDEPEGMYGIMSGQVRASSTTADGREVLLAVLESGVWFGESSLFDGMPRTYDAYAQGDCKLLLIPRAPLETLLELHPQLYRHFVQLLCQRIRLSLLLLESNGLLALEGRLANRLLIMTNAGQLPDPVLHVSQEDLSRMLGTSRQSINKVLKDWEQKQFIRRHYGSITLCNLAELGRLARAT